MNKWKQSKILFCILSSISLVLSHTRLIRAEDTIPQKYNDTTYVAEVHSISDGINSYFQALQNHSQTLTFSFDQNFDYIAYWNQLREILDKHTRTYADFNVEMLEIDVVSNQATLSITYYTTAQEEHLLDLFDAQLRSRMTGMSDYEKVKFVHDYLCQNVVYDGNTLADLANERSAYSALVNGQTVCSGYALAFQRIMEEENIPSKIICGNTPQGPHAWNVVCLDGNWYHLDTTWDDQEWGIDRSNFLIGTDKLSFTYQYDDMNFLLSPSSYS